MIEKGPIAIYPVPAQRCFTMRDARKYLAMDDDTIKKHIRDGRLKAKIVNGQRRFLLEELDRFLESFPDEEENGAGETPLPFPNRKKKGA